VGQPDKNLKAPSGAAEQIAHKILSSLRDSTGSFAFYPQLKLRAIFCRRAARLKQKKRPSLDAFAILFEEFYALSQFIFLTAPTDWRTDSPWL
jgi:hypothetical protein